MEKNMMKVSNDICLITNEVLKNLTKFDTNVVNKFKSFSLNMRNELNGLIKHLEKTVIV